jgi:hypothetical protein
VHLSPKAFQLLSLLISSRPRVVSKDELKDALWEGVFVSEGNLAVLVHEVRAILGEHGRTGRLIRTVQGFGYAFQGDVESIQVAEPDHSAQGLSYWLIWGTRVFALRQGTNVLGRQPDADVLLDFPGVSRLHAKISIQNDEATIEDLGSKNGTSVRNERLTSPQRIEDGDSIQIGVLTLIFRVWPSHGAETLTVIRERASNSPAR